MVNTFEIDSVQLFFGDRSILSDVYLRIQTGEIIALLGRNGSGMSSLIKIMFGSLIPQNSFIRLNDQVIKRTFLQYGMVAILPQESFLLPFLTVERSVNCFLTKETVQKCLNDPLLKDLIKSRISDLSGGEKRYLEIKLILESKAKFIFLDEPFNGISPLFIENIQYLIKVASKTAGILVSDHNYESVLEIATRQIVIHSGSLKHIKVRDDLVKWGYLSS